MRRSVPTHAKSQGWNSWKAWQGWIPPGEIPPDESLPSLRYGSDSSPPWTSPAYALPWSAYWTAYHSDSYYAGSNEDRLASIFRGRVGEAQFLEPELWQLSGDEWRERQRNRLNRRQRQFEREREREQRLELRREEQRRKDERTRERLQEERYMEELRKRERFRAQLRRQERRAERRQQQAILGVPSARSSHIRALDGTHAWKPGGGSLCGRMPENMDDWPVGHAAVHRALIVEITCPECRQAAT